jgi:hypothetical protein
MEREGRVLPVQGARARRGTTAAASNVNGGTGLHFRLNAGFVSGAVVFCVQDFFRECH